MKRVLLILLAMGLAACQEDGSTVCTDEQITNGTCVVDQQTSVDTGSTTSTEDVVNGDLGITDTTSGTDTTTEEGTTDQSATVWGANWGQMNWQ